MNPNQTQLRWSTDAINAITANLTNGGIFTLRFGDDDGDDDGSAGVREPRRPLPSAPAAAAELAFS